MSFFYLGEPSTATQFRIAQQHYPRREEPSDCDWALADRRLFRRIDRPDGADLAIGVIRAVLPDGCVNRCRQNRANRNLVLSELLTQAG